MNGQAPSYLCDKFTQRNQLNDRDTRSNEDLVFQCCELVLGKKLLSIELQNYGANLIKKPNY